MNAQVEQLLGQSNVTPRALPVKDEVTILVIDDDPRNLELITTILRGLEGVKIESCADPVDALHLAQASRPQIILVDWKMPRMDGMEVLQRVTASLPSTAVIVMTGHASTESTVEAMRQGAVDYLEKPFSIHRLKTVVGHYVERAKRICAGAECQMSSAGKFEGMLGQSPAILQTFATVERIAPLFRTALVTGPTGTGKELVARALHRLSPVAQNRFAVCNCSAIVETLFESELFGHVKGAFTGAFQDKVGLFEYAHGGTVFLDEIGEMPLTTQAKLLRVLQSQEIQRVGSPAVRRVDVRVVAATNRDLRAEVAAKRFREDLYYRLAMVEIQLSPLRERPEDLPLLVRSFIQRFAGQFDKKIEGVTQRAQLLLSRYAWPGNVRELENVIAHACMMASGSRIDVEDLPKAVFTPASSLVDQEWPTLEGLERRYVQQVLLHTGGNKAKATQILGIGRTTLYRAIRGIEDHNTNEENHTH